MIQIEVMLSVRILTGHNEDCIFLILEIYGCSICMSLLIVIFY